MAKVKPKRADSRSAEAAISAFQSAALGPIEPPATVRLRDGDRPIWDSIVLVRAREEWSEIDLHHAGNLARCLADIERISGEIGAMGDVFTNDRGTPIVNPRHALLETLSRRAVALTRLLHLHASVMVGRPADVANGRSVEREARATAATKDDDDLLASPTVQ